MTLRALALAVTAAALTCCSPSLIPGTEVQDTRENREVYGVVRDYAVAMQTKNAAALLALVAPDYLDNAGTPTPDDDMDRAALERSLAADLAKVDGLKLEITVRRIEVEGDRAMAQVYFDGYYKVTTPGPTVPKRASSLNQMTFRKVGKAWKITSGL